MPDRFALNTAQLRNLRNWSAAERPQRTLRLTMPVSPPVEPVVAKRAVRELVQRHEALRSRLAGEHWQEVSAWVELPVSTEPTDPGEPTLVDPTEHAAHCGLRLHDGLVAEIELTVSHAFVDALGVRALGRDLRGLLAGEPDRLPAQAREFALGPDAPRVVANTEHWRRLLTGAPRFCTYSGTVRDEHEPMLIARAPLGTADQERLSAACRLLRVTPSALWAAAVSIVVGRLCGQHRQVFRTTYANRFSRAELGAAAQLAQAVFVPVQGSGQDTLRARMAAVSSTLLSTYDKGVYDVNALLDWLNDPVRTAGVAFQPAFELNYVPRLPGDPGPVADTPSGRTTGTTGARIDPPSAKADLIVLISHLPEPVVQLSARRPVSSQRSPLALIDDCLRAVRALCEQPDALVTDVPVEPLPAAGGLCCGHHSGAALDLALTTRLVESVAGVESCALELRDTGLLHALVAGPIGAADLRRALRARQPWYTGTAVPDELTVVPAIAQPRST